MMLSGRPGHQPAARQWCHDRPRRGSGAEEGQQLPGDLVGPLLGEEVAAAGHGLAADVVGVAAPDVEHGQAAGQAAVAHRARTGMARRWPAAALASSASRSSGKVAR